MPGLDLARLADLPNDVLAEGRRVAEALSEMEERQEQDSRSNKVSIRRKALLRVCTPYGRCYFQSALSYGPNSRKRSIIPRYPMKSWLLILLDSRRRSCRSSVIPCSMSGTSFDK